MRNSLIAAALAFSLGATANAINRIGNNDEVPGFNGELHDSVEGFFSAVPKEFPNVNSVNDRSAQLFSSDEFTTSSEGFGGFSGPLTMFAYPLATAYPDLVNLDEAKVTEYMRTQFHAQVTVVDHKGCAFFLLGENDLGFVGIAKWGTSGYFLSVPKSGANSGREGIVSILKSTKIEKSCNP